MKLNTYFKLFTFVIITIYVMTCSKKETQVDDFNEKIIARIGDKTISKAEFLRRAEYTPRPNYCQLNFAIHKKIVLNSLVAEKLLALEGSDTLPIFQKDEINDYLKGRKEQAMRQILQFKMGNDQVKEIDTLLAAKLTKYSSRTYGVNFLTVSNKDTSELIKNALFNDNRTFESIASQYYNLDTLPARIVKWHEIENENVMAAMFSEPHNKGEIIGPIEITPNQSLFVKVNTWEGNVGESQQQFGERLHRVVEHKTLQKSTGYYNDYVRDVMKGKALNWNQEIFVKLVQIVGPTYLKSNNEKDNEMKNVFFQIGEREVQFKNQKDDLKDILDQELFDFDGESWSVERFLKYRRVHPLVFRQKKMKNHEFANNFQIAVIDMITDYELTKEAYNYDYDKINVVKRNCNMWKDNLAAMYMSDKFHFENVDDTLYKLNHEKAMEKYFNPYIDSLQQKYSDIIELNKEVFDEIELTRSPMIVYKTNAPFPIMVPAFPVVTTDHNLDYGKIMK